MKFLRFYFFLFSSVLFSQNIEATLHFTDGGESIKGYGEIFQHNKIRFSIEPESEVTVWTGDIVKGITFHEFERDIDFEYTFTKSFKRTPILLKVLVFGEVKLYVVPESETFIFNPSPIENPSLGISTNNFRPKVYYVKRDAEPFAIRLKGNFKKRIKDYFGDCIGIQKRIKNREFGWSTLPELVVYYNNYCIDF